jgi:orotidine-5'-phosphate decarboxylase
MVTPEHFADRLVGAMREKRSRVCVGIDPNYLKLPEAVAGPMDRRNGNDAAAVIDAFYAFTLGVLDAVAPVAACVKFQSAYFEQYHHDGVEAYFSLIQEAQDRGLLVIGDAKRGDIGATSSAYAAGHLLPHPADDAATADALTVNPSLGLDTLEPFVTAATDNGRGLFALVRTSNPGSGRLQDAQLADGRTWSEMLADGLAEIAGQHVGRSGYSLLGAVVGATQPQTMRSLRQRLPRSIFLLPGYGTQGATADMTRSAFDGDGLGAIVSASRSVTYAEPKAGEDWKQAVTRAAKQMRDDVAMTCGTSAG